MVIRRSPKSTADVRWTCSGSPEAGLSTGAAAAAR